MREILFRAKCARTNEWVFGVVVYRDNYCDYVFVNEKYGNRKLNITKHNVIVIGNIHDK